MIKIGEKFPNFDLEGTVSNNIDSAFKPFQNYGDNNNFQNKWIVAFFWPKDFTFVCPTEIAAFGELNDEFEDRDASIVGVSIDTSFVHLAWRQHNELLNNLPFPMLSDVKRELSNELGILDEEEGVAQRASFIIDPDGIVRFIMVTDLNVGRNAKEVLRVLDALQTDELCPCNWEKGEKTLVMA
ncbi:alkyl hydroperoxide reductase [bacterium]|nr:alkyl hydroperoxide reductase [Actinomycetota bacterium]MBE32575.1 alkyl hydroperoxide reductase [bacterium]|tara:strand:+ start:16 stop:567 length:552 start_codon:yes stop_codon:yes gene_type:complete